MNNGKLCKTDVTTKIIHLDNRFSGLFECYKGKKVKIVEQDSGCEFFFSVKKGQLIQEKSKRKTKKTKLEDKYRDFFELFALVEDDEIVFTRDDKNDCFVVEIKEKTGPNFVSMDKHEKEKLIGVVSKAYTSIRGEYDRIFNKEHYLPTTVSSYSINGFTERNLTFNFCHSYLIKQEQEKNPNAIVWQEVPINNTNGEHIDSIIIDNDNNWVIYLEAKRFYDIHHFKYLMDDLKRIKKKHSDIPLPNDSNLKPPLKKVVILLADHVCDVKKKEGEKAFYDKFFTCQKDYDLPEIDEKYPNLKKILPSLIKSTKITTVRDRTLTIPIRGEYNIKIEDEFIYTIYCGVYFIDEKEKK